ncbi:hypothetical protein DBR43_15220 [Pedobacter sp. KBW06]|uniref:hypothetical protein n=1 Tax=Pedobacter sp. KBW06 TaxID=2153359 RepID=UPI000F5A1D26|nr:hypothetical protein [Pedobacter sp. KBW06]RQO69431.1 hypothetical protein DBR43_15220 [Pedobacter sp. KBW06]
MKKIIIAFVVLFIANLGCKKISRTDGLCACSPATYPGVALVIKNVANLDLLNPANKEAYTLNQIKLFQKDDKGVEKQISFSIRPTFSYGSEKFNYYQLYSEEIYVLARTKPQSFYLKLADGTPYELNLEFKEGVYKPQKLLIDKKEAPAETGELAKYDASIFYLNL